MIFCEAVIEALNIFVQDCIRESLDHLEIVSVFPLLYYCLIFCKFSFIVIYGFLQVVGTYGTKRRGRKCPTYSNEKIHNY